ncbi:MAG: hypothetical protein K9K32_01845 [Halanaerobiales bacterium]|nr:hypothetical protein [Halanaerobiales bacterium]
MKKIYSLIKSDLKTIYRDTIMLFILLTPLIIGLFFKYSFPLLRLLANNYLSIDITKHYPFIIGFIINLIPLLQGMLVGFMILELRDQKILQYLSVTPLTKSGYLLYKISTSVLSSFIFSYLVLLLVGKLHIYYLKTVPIILMASLQAP